MKKLMLSVLCLMFALSAAMVFVGCKTDGGNTGGGIGGHTHSFTVQKAEQAYIASAATCTQLARYYYSCACGEKGIDSFYYGNALGHDFVDGACSRCGVEDTNYKPTEGLQYTLNSDGQSYSCDGIGTATDTNIVIAKEYNGLPVTTVGDEAFSGCSGLISITIPDGVISIGDYAFYFCSGLKTIEFKGTIAQWNAISKGYNWKYNVPSSCEVKCTDGTISI